MFKNACQLVMSRNSLPLILIVSWLHFPVHPTAIAAEPAPHALAERLLTEAGVTGGLVLRSAGSYGAVRRFVVRRPAVR